MEAVGRDPERGRIERWLSSPDGVLVIEGEAGIGKSTLWRAAVADAERLGLHVLTSAAGASETQLAFTTLRDLLTDVFEQIAGDLSAPQQRALAVTLLREDSTGSPPDPGAIAVATLAALTAVAAVGPTLIAVDDIQWVDEASAGALSYAVRRLDSSGPALLLARRIESEPTSALGLDELPPERVSVLRLRPLSVGAIGRIVHQRLGTAYPRPMLHKLHETSAGNPFFALELARAIEARGAPLRPGDPLPVPGTQRELLRQRLENLPAETRAALAFAAALARPTLPLVSAALGADAGDALVEATRAGIARLDGDSVRFEHPLFAAAMYELIGSQWSAVHARLAAVAADPEERARHLALATSEPDEAVARTIEEGARVAATRGSPGTAAELTEEALRLTPPEDRAEWSRRASESGWFYFTAGDAARARTLLQRASEAATPGDDRARVLLRLASVGHHALDRRAALDDVERITRDEAVGDLGILAEAHLVTAVSFWVLGEDISRADEHARKAVELSEEIEDPVHLVSSLAVQGMTEFTLGGGLPSPAFERALGIETETGDPRVLRRPLQHWAAVLLCADRYDEARPFFQQVHDLGVAHGDASVLPWPLMRLAHLELLAGNWARAEAHAEAGLDAARQTGQRPLEADLLCTRALVLAHRGRVDEARDAAETGMLLAESSGAGIGIRVGRWALGLLEVSLGSYDTAATRLVALHEVSRKAGIVEPGENRYLADLGEALASLERTSEAEALADDLEALGSNLERPGAVAIAARIRGLAALARGDARAAESELRRALDQPLPTPLPFERARTLLALGAAQRRSRQRRAARMTLDEALASFEELGADIWASRARDELARIAGRAPSTDGLTPTEERVAALVVQGRSNKEVAAELVVSVRTVEATLTSVYRKLDVRSRTELAHKLRDTTGSKP